MTAAGDTLIGATNGVIYFGRGDPTDYIPKRDVRWNVVKGAPLSQIACDFSNRTIYFSQGRGELKTIAYSINMCVCVSLSMCVYVSATIP